MASDTQFGETLRVGRCSCETARDRYHAPKNLRIDFEHMAPFLFNADDEDNSDEDEGQNDQLFDNDVAAQAQADIQEAIVQLQTDDSGSDNEEFFEFGNGNHLQADVQEAIQLLNMELDASDDQSEDELENAEDADDPDSTDGEQVEEEDPIVQGGNQGPPAQPDTEAHHKVPTIARWRLNLTALSQKYNLYFAAYRDKIHVSRPRSCVSHNLPSVPDIVICPGRSEAARSVGGTLDPTFPHQLNHLIIGDFGKEEILLMAYDDGDIIAYYTRCIERQVMQHEQCFHVKPPIAHTEPFFQENVKISAWGLAIHSISRLIAVGSNLHTVTVFAPALTGHAYVPTPGDSSRIYNTVVKNVSGLPTAWNVGLHQSNAANESWLRRRDANWAITLDTRPMGDNIPNVAFSSDETGNADKVVAIDVKGNVWLMPIWSFGIPSQKIPAVHRGPPNNPLPGGIGRPRGWGIIVIKGDSFLPVKGPKDLLGLHDESEARFASHIGCGKWLDITRGVKYIPHNSTQHPWAGSRQKESRAVEEFNRLVEHDWWFADYSAMTHRQLGFSSHESWRRPPGTHLLAGRDAILAYRNSNHQPKSVLADGASILRLYETDIELRSHKEDGVGVIMQHATKQIQPRPHGLPALRWAHERLSNNHYIPELSLVIAGSMCGRVALITLTKATAKSVFDRGFRIDAILPTKKDEDDRLRPICPLFGVAVGPVPVDGRPRQASPRRYRVMLQYYDQRILSYEISRGEDTKALLIT